MRVELYTKVSFFCLVGSLVLLSLPLQAAEQTMLVWGEQNQRDSVYDLYFSAQENGEWSAPEEMSDSGLPDILPSFGSNSRGDLWLVWTQLSDVTGRLQFRRRINGNWQPVQTLETGLKTNMAPSLIVDQQDIPWLVWAGVKDQDDDIYYSRWQGEDWTQPALVHPDNTVPDILPELSLSPAGYPRVRWKGYNNGEYVYFTREWNGSTWEIVADIDVLLRSATLMREQQDSAAADIPAFIKDRSQAAVLVEGRTGSIRIREER